MMQSSAMLRLKPGTKLQFNRVRGAWVVLSSERVFLPDEHAIEVLKLVNLVRTMQEIAQKLAAIFAAPVAINRANVHEMLQDFVARGAIRI